jgi:hypothetical protein
MARCKGTSSTIRTELVIPAASTAKGSRLLEGDSSASALIFPCIAYIGSDATHMPTGLQIIFSLSVYVFHYWKFNRDIT